MYLTDVHNSSKYFLGTLVPYSCHSSSSYQYTRVEKYPSLCPVAILDTTQVTQHLETRMNCKAFPLLSRSPSASMMHHLCFAVSISLLFPILSNSFFFFSTVLPLFLHIRLSETVRYRLSHLEEDLETTDFFYST